MRSFLNRFIWDRIAPSSHTCRFFASHPADPSPSTSTFTLELPVLLFNLNLNGRSCDAPAADGSSPASILGLPFQESEHADRRGAGAASSGTHHVLHGPVEHIVVLEPLPIEQLLKEPLYTQQATKHQYMLSIECTGIGNNTPSFAPSGTRSPDGPQIEANGSTRSKIEIQLQNVGETGMYEVCG